ncbi:MAG: ROK family protein [candidate division Zixibacteria bacterium]|nr:ROK family protein [candidate division Zixibacteria bacterium]
MKNKFNIGADIGGSNIKYGIVSSSGRIMTCGIIPSGKASGKKGVLRNLRKGIDSLLVSAKQSKLNINSIGIGVPGTVDLPKGKIVGIPPNLPFLADFYLRKYLKGFYHHPVYIDNDANVMALAEYKFGAAKGFDNCICITLGTGIGSGIILKGKLFRGSSFVGPEFGHTTICYDGVRCHCGNYGCVEMYASEPAMIKRAKELLKKNSASILYQLTQDNLNRLKAKDLFLAERLKDKVSQKVIQETAYYLGTALSSAVNLINPEIVVVGGGVALSAGRNFFKMIEKEIKTRAFPSATKNLKIVKAKLGNNAGFIGASRLGEELGAKRMSF